MQRPSGNSSAKGIIRGELAGFATEAQLQEATRHLRTRRELAMTALLLLIIFTLPLLLRTTLSLVRHAKLLPTRSDGAMLARIWGLGLPLESALGPDAALDASPWLDTSDQSWDTASNHLNVSIELRSRATLTLWSIPLGPQDVTLTAQVYSAKAVPGDLQSRVVAKLVRDIAAGAREPRPDTPRFPDDVEYEIRTNTAWDHLASASLAPGQLSPLTTSPSIAWQSHKSTIDWRWTRLWCALLLAPPIVFVASIGALKLFRRARHLRTGCERCGFPLLAHEAGGLWSFARCSECGHDTTPALLHQSRSFTGLRFGLFARRTDHTNADRAPQS
jgi:hypothetical protein